jgi:glycerophosphoryl diester phosphodiesterase
MPTSMNREWLRIAHRGASGSAPEHTRPAFERALDCGVDMIELDVQLSSDGVLVVLHDLDLQRTTGVAGAVRARSVAEIKTLDAGGWYGARFSGQPVLSLDEVIDIVGTRARLNVELKAPEIDWPLLATTLTDTLRRRGLLEASIISCFEPAALQVVHECDAHVRLGLLWQRTEFEEVWAWARRLEAVSLHPHWMLISTELVDAAHARGLQVITWTVNDIETMRDLVRLGVDGIISDHPERFLAVES